MEIQLNFFIKKHKTKNTKQNKQFYIFLLLSFSFFSFDGRGLNFEPQILYISCELCYFLSSQELCYFPSIRNKRV